MSTNKWYLLLGMAYCIYALYCDWADLRVPMGFSIVTIFIFVTHFTETLLGYILGICGSAAIVVLYVLGYEDGLIVPYGLGLMLATIVLGVIPWRSFVP